MKVWLNKNKKNIAAGCSLLISALLLIPSGFTAPARLPRPGAAEQIVAKVVCQLLARHHYNRQPLNDEISSELFNNYFERLDNSKTFFLQSDIDEFSSYRTILDDLLQQGNVDFAYDVYTRYIQRVRERLVYTEKRLKQGFDFAKDEEILLDRSKEPWCTTVEEMDEIWRKRLKNKVLTYKLMRGEQIVDDPETVEPLILEPDDAEPQPQGGPDEDTGESEVPSFSIQKTPEERTLQLYQRLLSQMEENDAVSILEMFLNSFTRIYDPHSAYMAPETEEDFDIQMKLSLQGIGAVLTVEDSYVKVSGIIPGGPASQEGTLKAGDRIVAVAQDGEEPIDVIDMPLRRVVRLIRGPKDTRVHLFVLDANKGMGSVPVTISITRDEVKLTEQEAKSRILQTSISGDVIIEKTETTVEIPEAKTDSLKLAVIELPSFYSDFGAKRAGDKDYKSSTRDVEILVDEARQAKADGIILDLRGNGGGSLDEAISLAGIFMPAGPVVQVRDANRRINVRKHDNGQDYYKGPLVVLIDRLSASASEIVAAALQDHYRAVVVGDKRTHGKGTVQTVYQLRGVFRSSSLFKDQEPGALKFTIAQFYRCNGESTQSRGVIPDVIFPSFFDHMGLGEAEIPHALPWDKINALELNPAIDISHYIPSIIYRSWKRTEKDEEHRQRTEIINKFKERRERKTITVNQEARQALQKDDEEWAEKMRNYSLRRRRNNIPDDDEEDSQEEIDPVMNEALRILADLINLQDGRLEIADAEILSQREPVQVDKTVETMNSVEKN